MKYKDASPSNQYSHFVNLKQGGGGGKCKQCNSTSHKASVCPVQSDRRPRKSRLCSSPVYICICSQTSCQVFMCEWVCQNGCAVSEYCTAYDNFGQSNIKVKCSGMSSRFCVTKVLSRLRESRRHCLQLSLWTRDEYILTPHHIYRVITSSTRMSGHYFFVSDHQTCSKRREEGDWFKLMQEDAVKTLFWLQFHFCSCWRYRLWMAGPDVAPNLPPLQYLHQRTRVVHNPAF